MLWSKLEEKRKWKRSEIQKYVLVDARTHIIALLIPPLLPSLTAIILNGDCLHRRPHPPFLCAILAAVVWVRCIAENRREAEYAAEEIELEILRVLYHIVGTARHGVVDGKI